MSKIRKQSEADDLDAMPVVAVVGAGVMGASITVALTQAGFAVKLKDVDAVTLAKGMHRVDDLLKRLVDKGLSSGEASARLLLVEPVETFAALADVDFAIEAVSEDLCVKQKVFEQLDKYCQKSKFLASNTSSLSISQIGSFTEHPQKVIGLHFFNPAHIMKLVEVIPGLRTSAQTVKTAIAFGDRLGKFTVQVEECPSFLVNRLLARYLNEALFMVEQGLGTVAAVDEAACRLLMPIGPLALRDMNGLDVGLAVALFNFQEYGERFKPAPILAKMVDAKMLGRKTSAGFYKYKKETRKAQGVNADFLQFLDPLASSAPAQISNEEALQLFLPMINEAFLVLQERICRPEDLDPALKAGLGMRKGPLEFAFELGLGQCLKRSENLFEVYGERFRPAPLLKRFVWAGKTTLN